MNGEQLRQLYTDCTLCPRRCHADRYAHPGFCGAGTEPKLARAALHEWEEPCLVGRKASGARYGAGAVFFSHCTLRCRFCQNYQISAEGFGREISIRQLADIFLRLQDEGAACLDLVTASHYLPSVIGALELVRPKLCIPVVYNCGGYESAEALRLLDGYVDIYLPDLKYYSDELALRYSGAPHYFETALNALREMLRQTGRPVCSVSGDASPDCSREAFTNGEAEIPDGVLLKKGVLVRHMVLPGCRQDSISLLRALAEAIGPRDVLISLLSQYTPFYQASEYPELNRRITSFEYDSVVREARRLGFPGYMQEKSAAKEEYTPSFSLEGVCLSGS